MSKAATIVITTNNKKKWWQFWKAAQSIQSYEVVVPEYVNVIKLHEPPPIGSEITITYDYKE